MAPHAEDEVLEGRLSRSAIDTLPVRVAILDDEGSILSSNRAWQEFAEANDIPMCPDGVGVNYPEVADASDNAHATRAATGLRSLLRGERDRFELEYSWHSGGKKRWFLMRAVPFTQDGDRYVTLTQIEITNRRAREQALRDAYEIAAASDRSLSQQIDALLEVVRTTLGTDFATLSRVNDDEYVFEAFAGPADVDVQSGETVPLDELPNCERVVESGRRLVLEDGEAEAPELSDPEWGIASYLGVPVTVDGEVYGTFCFYSTEPRDEAFSDWAVTFVELLSNWVTYELERQRYTARLIAMDTAFPDLGFLIDGEGRYLEYFASPDTSDLLYGDPDDIMGRTLSEVLPKDTAELLHETVRDAVETGQLQTVEYELTVQAGTRFFEARMAPLTDAKYRRDAVIFIARDITDRKERERALAYRTALLEAQGETTIDGRLVVDTDRNVLYHNDRFLDMWNIPKSVAADRSDEALLESVRDLLADPDKFQERVEYHYEHPGEKSYDTIELSDGRWFNRYSAPVVGDDGTHYGRLWTFRDITERKAREEALEAQRDELAQLQRLNTIGRKATQALQDAATPEAIETAVCEHLTESSLYRAVWIGTRGESTTGEATVIPREAAGVDETSLDGISDGETGPAQMALRSGEIQVINDIATAERIPDAWRETGLTLDYHALAAVPLTTGETTYGALVVYTPRDHTISAAEQDILTDLGQSIALAIQRVHSQRSLAAKTAVTLDLQIPNTDFAFGEISTALDCELSLARRVETSDGTIIYYVTVKRAGPEEVCEFLDGTTVVASCSVVREKGESRSALLEVHLAERQQLPLDVLTDYGASVKTARAKDGDIYLSVELPPRADIRGVLNALREVAPSTKLVSKQHVDRPAKTVSDIQAQVKDRLTLKQEATLKAAYARGYYAWPRDSTMEDLAETFDVSAPTLHYRLRKAHDTVITALFDGENTSDDSQ